MIMGMLDMCLLERRNIPTVQWGFISESNGTSDYKAFPITFNTAYALATVGSFTGGASWAKDLNKSGFLAGNGNDYTAIGDKNIYYVAIGQ